MLIRITICNVRLKMSGEQTGQNVLVKSNDENISNDDNISFDFYLATGGGGRTGLVAVDVIMLQVTFS